MGRPLLAVQFTHLRTYSPVGCRHNRTQSRYPRHEESELPMSAVTEFVNHVTDHTAGVTYHFSDFVEVGRYWNDDIFVVSRGSDIEIVRITPDSMILNSGRVINGAVVNPSIENSQSSTNGFDSGIAYNSYDHQSNVDPIQSGTSLLISHDSYPLGASVVKVISNEESTDARHATYDNSVLTIVNEPPPAGAFRPSVSDSSKESNFTIYDLDFSILQSVEPVPGQRPISDFDDLQHATVPSWITQGSSSRGHYPTRYFDDYGDYRMEALVEGFMALHSEYSNEEKSDLFAAFVQIGLDYAGAVSSGKVFTSGGGGLNNYVKPFVVLAATALKDDVLSEKAGYNPDVYGEDQQFFYVSEQHTNYSSFNWGSNKRPVFQEQYIADQIGIPEWGVFTFDDRNSSLLDGSSYRAINSDTMIQVSLVIEMLGEQAATLWDNQAYFDYADRAYDFYVDQLPDHWREFYEEYHHNFKTSADWEGVPETILDLVVGEGKSGVTVEIPEPSAEQASPVFRTDLRYSDDGETWTVLFDVGSEITLTNLEPDTFLYFQARHVNELGASRWSLNNFTARNAEIHETLQAFGFEDVPTYYSTAYGLGRNEYSLLNVSYQDHLSDLLNGIEDRELGKAAEELLHGTIQTDLGEQQEASEAELVVVGEIHTFAMNGSSQTFEFDHNFENPIVITKVTSHNGGQPLEVQILEIETDSVTAQLSAPEYLERLNWFEDVTLFVVEAGTHTLSDGSLIEAGSVNVNTENGTNFTYIDFETEFEISPAILTQIQSAGDDNFAVTRQRLDEQGGFRVASQQEEALTNQSQGIDTIGWMAIEQGIGQSFGLSFEAGHTGRAAHHNATQFGFNTEFESAPILLAGLSSSYGGNTATLAVERVSTTGFDALALEEKSHDMEIWHGRETVDYLAFDQPGSLMGYQQDMYWF